MIEWLPWLPSKSCYTNLKFFETLKDTPNPSKGFRFVAFLVLEILGGVLFDPLVLCVGTKTLGAWRVELDDNGCCRIHSISDDGNGWIVTNERYVVMPWKMVTRHGKNMTLTEAVDSILNQRESEAKECERRERERKN